MTTETYPVLTVRNLRTHFYTKSGVAKAVDDVSFTLDRGQTLGIVGESGSGKSITLMSLVRLVPEPAGRIVGGEILLDGQELRDLSDSEMRAVRGAKIAVVTQDPMSSLNPVFTVANQLAEPFRQHQHIRARDKLKAKVLETLLRVGIPRPESRMNSYPHQFSGGQRQRIVTAMAIGCAPSVLIADEPTTSLDVTIQAQILELLRDVQREVGFGMIIVTHDLSVVARTCDAVAVMYAGRIVEKAPLQALFAHPQHPYTRALISAVNAEVDERGRLRVIEGQPPDVRNLPSGCAFAERCPLVRDICQTEYPPTITVSPEHTVACWEVSERLGPDLGEGKSYD